MSWAKGIGRNKSRNHHAAWLVAAGEVPNRRSPSLHKIKHSHIDQRWESVAPNSSIGAGVNGVKDARMWDRGSNLAPKDEVSANCCSSSEWGSSTRSTAPATPSINAAPGQRSGQFAMF